MKKALFLLVVLGIAPKLKAQQLSSYPLKPLDTNIFRLKTDSNKLRPYLFNYPALKSYRNPQVFVLPPVRNNTPVFRDNMPLAKLNGFTTDHMPVINPAKPGMRYTMPVKTIQTAKSDNLPLIP
jgi:hypothetical protein